MHCIAKLECRNFEGSQVGTQNLNWQFKSVLPESLQYKGKTASDVSKTIGLLFVLQLPVPLIPVRTEQSALKFIAIMTMFV